MSHWGFQEKSKCLESVPHPPSMKIEQIRGKKIARNKNPCNKNPTKSGWNYCSSLQLSVQFFRATRKLLTKFHSLKALKQLPCCAEKNARKVASKSNNSNPRMLDFYCMDFYRAKLSCPVSLSPVQGGASARLSEVKNESRRDFTPTPH